MITCIGYFYAYFFENSHIYTNFNTLVKYSHAIQCINDNK